MIQVDFIQMGDYPADSCATIPTVSCWTTRLLLEYVNFFRFWYRYYHQTGFQFISSDGAFG